MDDVNSRALVSNPEGRRALKLIERRDRLAGLLV